MVAPRAFVSPLKSPPKAIALVAAGSDEIPAGEAPPLVPFKGSIEVSIWDEKPRDQLLLEMGENPEPDSCLPVG